MSRRFHTCFAALIALAPVAAPAAVRDHLSAVELFGLADEARTAGRADQAETLYDALSHDPDPEIRAEALFRKGMMLGEQKKYRRAAVTFRHLLDEKPDATRVRLDVLGVEEVNLDAAVACEPGEHLAIHDGVGPALVRHETLGRDVLGEVCRPGS